MNAVNMIVLNVLMITNAIMGVMNQIPAVPEVQQEIKQANKQGYKQKRSYGNRDR